MKSIKELRDNLANLFDQIKSGETDVKHAAEMNNTAGKIINSLRVELEYAELRKITPSISFMDYQD